MKFNLKLHQCCDKYSIRESMQYIFFDGDQIIATTAHILMVVHIDDLDLTEDETKAIKKANGKLIHHRAFMKIWNKEIIFEDNGISCPEEHIFIPYKDQDDFKYPNWKKVIPKLDKKQKTTSINLNPTFLKTLTDCFPCESNGFSLVHSRETEAITVFSINNLLKSYGIIMPVMKNDDSEVVLNEKTMLFDPVI